MFRKCKIIFVILAFAIISQVALAAPLVKIKNLGQDRYLHVASSGTKYLTADKTGVGSLDIFYKEEFGGGVFALKCPSTGTYVSVYPGTYDLYVGTATTATNTEKFELAWGGTNWGFKSVAYGYYISAYTANAKLSATWSYIVGLYEQYCFTQVVDMYLAMKAWPDHYSNKYKLADTTQWPNYNTEPQMYFQDERLFDNGSFWEYEEFRSRDLTTTVAPIWNLYGLRMIGDWEVLCCYKTIPLQIDGWNWVQGIPRCVRYLDFNYSGETPSSRISVDWYSIKEYCTEVYGGTAYEWGVQGAATVLDLSNPNSQINMGQRWIVTVGYSKNGIDELWSVDIGPYDANYPNNITIDPIYGEVRYYRHDPNHPEQDTYTINSNIQNKWNAYPNRCE